MLVEPKYGGNIGAVARVMKNFDFHRLYLVNPGDLDDECYIRSVHASDILDTAQCFESFKDAVEHIDFLIATSSIETISDKKHLRRPVFLHEFSKDMYKMKGTIGLIFGREDYGLYNDEIAACDLMVKIPSSSTYPSLNLSHAVGVVLYTLYLTGTEVDVRKRHLDNIEKRHLFNAFSSLLEEIHHPEHKKEKTTVMFKRIMGRALPSKWEYHTLMGVIHTAAEKLKKRQK
ncbi:RNA methyltransferase [Pseudomonadota bacterium]